MFNNGGEPFVEGIQKNSKYLKFLILSLIFCFTFALNLFPDLSSMIELTYKDVPEFANQELL
jgi:hypothetical protein